MPVGLLPGNRAKDNETFGLKFRSESKEFNSDEKVYPEGYPYLYVLKH